ncbi:hypothetical protein [Acinetobacter lwoffii]|uniref:hypothetical protein n=1 Tax=Acinetobacter lwoffii TaxID=28090 RepID=UPI00148ED637|nr:hypothetical protein [Acinetobacter lwoffii]
MIDAAAIYLMLAIQTGWNKETILSIDPNNYEHVLSGTLSENQCKRPLNPMPIF